MLVDAPPGTVPAEQAGKALLERLAPRATTKLSSGWRLAHMGAFVAGVGELLYPQEQEAWYAALGDPGGQPVVVDWSGPGVKPDKALNQALRHKHASPAAARSAVRNLAIVTRLTGSDRLVLDRRLEGMTNLRRLTLLRSPDEERHCLPYALPGLTQGHPLETLHVAVGSTLPERLVPFLAALSSAGSPQTVILGRAPPAVSSGAGSAVYERSRTEKRRVLAVRASQHAVLPLLAETSTARLQLLDLGGLDASAACPHLTTLRVAVSKGYPRPRVPEDTAHPLPALRRLVLEGHSAPLSPAALLACWPELRELRLHVATGPDLGTSPVAWLSEAPHLVRLALGALALALPEGYLEADLPALSELELRGCRVADLWRVLAGCPSLASLRLESSDVLSAAWPPAHLLHSAPPDPQTQGQALLTALAALPEPHTLRSLVLRDMPVSLDWAHSPVFAGLRYLELGVCPLLGSELVLDERSLPCLQHAVLSASATARLARVEVSGPCLLSVDAGRPVATTGPLGAQGPVEVVLRGPMLGRLDPALFLSARRLRIDAPALLELRLDAAVALETLAVHAPCLETLALARGSLDGPESLGCWVALRRMLPKAHVSAASSGVPARRPLRAVGFPEPHALCPEADYVRSCLRLSPVAHSPEAEARLALLAAGPLVHSEPLDPEQPDIKACVSAVLASNPALAVDCVLALHRARDRRPTGRPFPGDDSAPVAKRPCVPGRQ